MAAIGPELVPAMRQVRDDRRHHHHRRVLGLRIHGPHDLGKL
jgi:hypothetical protein